MQKTIFGLFNSWDDADRAIVRLEEAGLNKKNVSVIVKDRNGGAQITQTTTAGTGEEITSGAAVGGAIGALAGLLVGIGAISLPGIGAILIGGPLAAALGLTGAAATTVAGAVTGALAGGFVGALVSLGVPKEEALVYEKGIQEGGVMLAVETTEEAKARTILENAGATTMTTVEARDKTI